MNDERREEWISAYIDGELAPEERAQVEGWLAESAELRHLCDELRAAGVAMSALPRRELGRDLAPAVLSRAERAVLAGAASRAAEGQAPAAVSAGSIMRSWWLSGAGWRRLVGPSLALAAALAILVYERWQPSADRQIAQAPPKGEMQLQAPRPLRLAEDALSSGQVAHPLRGEADALPADASSSELPATQMSKQAEKAPMRELRGELEAESPASAAAPSDARGRLQLRRGANEEKPPQVTVEVEVAPEFIRDRRLATLLESTTPLRRKVVNEQEREEGLRENHPADKDLSFFFVAADTECSAELTQEQLAAVLAELRKSAAAAPRVTDHESSVADKPAKTPASAKRRVDFILRPTATGGDRPPQP